VDVKQELLDAQALDPVDGRACGADARKIRSPGNRDALWAERAGETRRLEPSKRRERTEIPNGE
jgi:hypothetical protein